MQNEELNHDFVEEGVFED